MKRTNLMRAYNNENHKQYMDEFHHFAKTISDKFNVSIALVGKLGIEEYFNKYIGAETIDVLIPDNILIQDFQNMLLNEGYEILDLTSFTKNGKLFTYDYLNKYLDLCKIKDLNNLIKVLLNDPSDDIKNDSKLLVEWVKDQNGYYLFDRESLEIMYSNSEEIMEILKNESVKTS